MSETETKGDVYIIFNELYGFYGEDVFTVGKTIDIQKIIGQYTTSYISPVEIRFLSAECIDDSLAESYAFYTLKHYRMKSNRDFVKVSMLLIVETSGQTVWGVNNGTITSVPSFTTVANIKTINILTETERIQCLGLTGQSDEVLEEFEDVISSIESVDEYPTYYCLVTMRLLMAMALKKLAGYSY